MSPAPTDGTGSAIPVSAAQIHQLIAGLDTHIDLGKLTDSTPFAEAGMDSLDFFNLVLAIEDKFGVTIPPDQLEKVNSVEKAMRYINEGAR